ncbi:MAG: IS110 family RNA-guided transposase [Steroidobacteraceae bacterium]
MVYEAGPCGYGWARYLLKHGWRCEVIAPSRITRQAAEKRVKTDRRDAILLARESRSGNLSRIVVPDERDEAMRDLSRAREDAVAARKRVRQQMKAMLLRHGRDYVRFRSWSAAHERHLSTIRFDHPAQELAFNEYRLACKEADERIARIVQALRELCQTWRMDPLVKALMYFKGFDFVAAVTFVAEIGDLTRFSHPRELMAYVGLVPSIYASGNGCRLGSITKAGNKHARRILIEAAWDNRFKAQITRTLEVRQEGQPKIIREVSWKAQLRLSMRWRKLLLGRKIHSNKVCVAVARELAGFIWDAGRQIKIKA